MEKLLFFLQISVCGQTFSTDDMTNITPRILSQLEAKLHLTARHPLHHIKQRIVNFMYSEYKGHRGNPLFSVFDDLNPVVTVEQNFDELLVPADHVCRNKRDNYYINSRHLLRAHTSAHQVYWLNPLR